VPDRSVGPLPVKGGTQPPELVAVLPVHGDEYGQAIKVNGEPEMIGDLAGRADLAQGVVPAAGEEQHPGYRQVVQAEEEGAQSAFREAQAGRVRLPRLGVPVQVEQAVGTDQMGVELAIHDQVGTIEHHRGLTGEVRRLAEAALPAARGRYRLQPVGHRTSILAGQAFIPAALGLRRGERA
jgi:hypothetical protein